eukprot:Tamp_22111.p1 GENE.Tamp_22111~~Tamp_22111.p1  ORF type:complete len:202 (+),score=25.73 Tamp_22111:354-959(+)
MLRDAGLARPAPVRPEPADVRRAAGGLRHSESRALMARQWRARSRWLAGLRVCLALAAAACEAGVAACVGPARQTRGQLVLVADAGVVGGIAREILPPGAKPPRFVPSYEWQRVLPGQSVPPGLWVKMDVRTGDTYAKFLGGPEVPDPCAQTPWPRGAGGPEAALAEMAEKFEHAKRWLTQLVSARRSPRTANFSLPPSDW